MNITIGTRVRTVAVPDPPTDWTEEARRARKFGVLGTVIRKHNSHGLCYVVRHDDDTIACYEPQELAPADYQTPEELERLAEALGVVVAVSEADSDHPLWDPEVRKRAGL